ncbi:ATPase family AAA domain-containing protein At1g05910 [Silene latifolia]|uniref:ATPase family AAA domain-containing protein At1g05910 n=1 Tax=Silene latifolia TaxID=37657 RepID=UPI003D775C65
MHSRRSNHGTEINGNVEVHDSDNNGLRATRTSSRIKRRPMGYKSPFYYTSGSMLRNNHRKKKAKTRTAAAHIAKMLSPGGRSIHASKKNLDVANLRRSTRQRRVSVNLEDYTNSSGSDEDLMKPRRHRTRNRIENSVGQDELSTLKRRKIVETRSTPRREGLRPRGSKAGTRHASLTFDEEEGTSEEKDDQDEMENGNNDDDNNDEGEGDDEGEAEGDGEGEEENEREEDGEDDEGEDEEGEEEEEEEEEEQDGRRRYDLRNRAEVRRLSIDESKQRLRSPRRILRHGMGNKVSRDARKGGSRVHKRHRFSRIEDSDDSLLVDEMDQGPAIPWARNGSKSGAPWLLGGLDMQGGTSLGLNIAASGWVHQSDTLNSLTSGVQTAGPSSKGGADIQPLQVDDNISFDDIGGLSEYIDALKEMVFFPLLYPDFFASYNITPPRGVLLCGPPGTGKTLIARALACSASKAGQKVSFYMRKGADVLSKWVGEAERQLKLLFEEAQRNQPSIIFFDEIDGLAPVRSSKQEQIHNSIVSTLLALMDGLDSRGQVVLIGATNRIDAIDGALRRPGRFDREFNFPLPGLEARGEIIDIHTRKWKHPPSKNLRTELAASCVGYCGADLKALCTEAAIRAFREKYPQVYTSDDKFLIDVDSVRVEKTHFFDAMSTITPAAHRGSIVHSRPLSAVVAPCLGRHLRKAMACISDIFPASAMSSELLKLSMLSYGSAIPLVYKPRLLLYGKEGVGLDHLGPAILHELEKFPVHSLGLPSLLSDPSAKTPEEALVHILGEARRTTPSILYLPHFDLWWENAHDQLRAVLLSLLEELPSDLPILLLGTTSELFPDIERRHQIFTEQSIFEVDAPAEEDRSLFFDRLIEASLSVTSETVSLKPQTSTSLPELPKAPKVTSGPNISELKAKVEAEQHALRRLRMCLRDVCNRILYDKRFSAFHYPVSDEDAPNYRSVIQNPMDVATLLQRVDSGHYIKSSDFQQDVDLILSNAKIYNGDDYNGARIVSRAHELRDAVYGMLSQMDPALVAFCDKIAAQGGPSRLPDGYGSSALTQTPVVQTLSLTRASARLRNVQPEVNLDQSYEALKRPKKNSDSLPTATTAEEKSKIQEPEPTVSTEEAQHNITTHIGSDSVADKSNEDDGPTEPEQNPCERDVEDDIVMADGDTCDGEVETIKQKFMERTKGYGIPLLERLYARIIKGVFNIKSMAGSDNPKSKVLQFLLKFSQDETNF